MTKTRIYVSSAKTSHVLLDLCMARGVLKQCSFVLLGPILKLRKGILRLSISEKLPQG